MVVGWVGAFEYKLPKLVGVALDFAQHKIDNYMRLFYVVTKASEMAVMLGIIYC